MKAPVAAVEPTKNWAKSAVVALRVRSDRTVMSCSSPMLPAAKLASSVPSSARRVVVAFLICRSAAALCSRGVWTKLVAVSELTVRSAVGATPGAFGDPAVDRRDRAAEGVEGHHQGVAAVALAVRLDLDDAAVAQDRPSGEGRPEEQAADEVRRELLLDEVEEAVALGHRRVPSQVPGVELPVRFRLRVGVAGELERGVCQDGGGRQGRPAGGP